MTDTDNTILELCCSSIIRPARLVYYPVD